MTAKDEDILTSQSLLERGLALDRLLQNVLIDKRIDVRSLLRGDKDALLIACRKYGYGVDYEVEIMCNSCFEDNQHTFDISEWKTKDVIKDEKLDYKEDGAFFSTILPSSRVEVYFKLLTSYETSKIEKKIEENKNNKQLESYNALFLSSILVSVAGYNDSTSIKNFIEGVPAKDALFLRNLYEHVEPKLSTNCLFVCKHCKTQEDLEVPLGPDFFWPKR